MINRDSLARFVFDRSRTFEAATDAGTEFDSKRRRRDRSIQGSGAATIFVCLLAIAPLACGPAHDGIPAGQDVSDRQTRTAVSTGASPTAATPLAPRDTDGGRSPGADAADVIRTRIAWREHSEGGVPWPTPTPPPPLTVTSAGGAVWAHEIGLMWSEEAVGVFEYRDADAHCQGLKIAGFDDWRIPSITELELLLATEFSPAWRVEIGALWTSTQYNLREVQTIVFPDRSRSHQEVGMAHVLCVRSLD